MMKRHVRMSKVLCFNAFCFLLYGLSFVEIFVMTGQGDQGGCQVVLILMRQPVAQHVMRMLFYADCYDSYAPCWRRDEICFDGNPVVRV